MKLTLASVAVVLLSSSVGADEVLLKDGRKIEFKVLTDAGDSYELITPVGTKISVKKSDFDKIIPVDTTVAPLTGASFTFDKKQKLETVDLFAKIDPKRDTVTGNWKLTPQGLRAELGDGVEWLGRLAIPVTPPEEYDLTAVVTRTEGVQDFAIGLVGGGKQFSIQFDGWFGVRSGLMGIDGKDADANGTGIPGKFFVNGKAKTMVFMVRKEGVIVVADGKDFIVWKADWDRIALSPQMAIPSKKHLILGVGKGAVLQITRLTLTSPKS